ncbi:MAG: hypothetical protein IJ225_08160 [Solobacterium sp.]|nr:hypothetical protein [Solobacterium sp.]
MSQIFNSQAFYYVLVIGFAGYTVYYLWDVFKFLKGNLDARKRYKEKYGMEGSRNVNQFWGWTIAYLAMVIYCIFSAVTLSPEAEQAEWFRMAFLFVGLILFGQMIVAGVKRSAVIGPDAFVIEDAVIGWKSVLNMDPKKKGLQRIVDLQTTQGKYVLSREMGLVFHKEYEEWRKAKKEKKGKK